MASGNDAPTRCPHAASCWMGGGSYACVKTPPFCDRPLIPKEVDRPEVKVVQAAIGDVIQITVQPPKLEIKAVSYRFDWEGKDADSPTQSAIKQGELF